MHTATATRYERNSVMNNFFFRNFLIISAGLSLTAAAGCMKHPGSAEHQHTVSEAQPCESYSSDPDTPSPTKRADAAANSGAMPAVYETGSPTGPEGSGNRFGMDYASDLNAEIHDIAVQIIDNLGQDPGTEGVVGVATFVDLNYLYRTSPFGRYISEQLMGELQRAGFQIVEIRKTDSLLIKEHYGEYSLSREIEEIARQTSARMILLGTYLAKGDYVFVNARLVSSANSMVESSALKILRRDSFMKKMLWPAAAPRTGKAVKIPIKAFGKPTEIRIIQGS